MDNKLIIAGADGYIGQRIQNSLNKNVQLLLLSTLLDNKYNFFDLLQLSKFNFNIINKSDTIVLLAGISSPDVCNENYQYSFNINVIGTIEFIRNCLKKGARVLFFSSDAIYGHSSGRNNEDIFPENPLGEYGNMKLLIEKYFKDDINFKSFRLSYVFSWNDKFMKYLRSCLDEKKIAEVYDPLIRKVVFIEDLIQCIQNLHNEWDKFDNQYYNICGPKYLSRIEIANYFIKHVGHLDLEIIKPDDKFYEARPQKIFFNSKYSTSLLGKKFTLISDAIQYEKSISIQIT
jgi:dTDP-4-dehydrorhamnose reductase